MAPPSAPASSSSSDQTSPQPGSAAAWKSFGCGFGFDAVGVPSPSAAGGGGGSSGSALAAAPTSRSFASSFRFGRKKGACFGFASTSVGRFLSRSSSRWKSACQCALGSVLRVISPARSGSLLTTAYSPSPSPSSSPSPSPSPGRAAAGASAAAPASSPSASSATGAGSSMSAGSVGTRSAATRSEMERSAQRLMPRRPRCAVARNSPPGLNAMPVAGRRKRSQSTQRPVGRSQRRSAPSASLLAILRPSPAKQRSEMTAPWPTKERTSSRVARSATRTTRSSHAKAARPLSLWSASCEHPAPRCRPAPAAQRSAKDHQMTLPSRPQLSRKRPAASTATPVTAPSWAPRGAAAAGAPRGAGWLAPASFSPRISALARQSVPGMWPRRVRAWRSLSGGSATPAGKAPRGWPDCRLYL